MSEYKRKNMTVDLLEGIVDLYNHGYTPIEIRQKLGVSDPVVRRYIRRLEGRPSQNDFINEAVLEAYCHRHDIEYVPFERHTEPEEEEIQEDIPEPEVETEQKQDMSAVVEQLKQISETLSRMQNCLESMCFVWGANINKEA